MGKKHSFLPLQVLVLCCTLKFIDPSDCSAWSHASSTCMVFLHEIILCLLQQRLRQFGLTHSKCYDSSVVLHVDWVTHFTPLLNNTVILDRVKGLFWVTCPLSKRVRYSGSCRYWEITSLTSSRSSGIC